MLLRSSHSIRGDQGPSNNKVCTRVARQDTSCNNLLGHAPATLLLFRGIWINNAPDICRRAQLTIPNNLRKSIRTPLRHLLATQLLMETKNNQTGSPARCPVRMRKTDNSRRISHTSNKLQPVAQVCPPCSVVRVPEGFNLFNPEASWSTCFEVTGKLLKDSAISRVGRGRCCFGSVPRTLT